MSKISPHLYLVILITLILGVSACGNKGDLYRESDAEALKELEDAAEKLKKKNQDAEQSPDN